jgi:hypothetical protein
MSEPAMFERTELQPARVSAVLAQSYPGTAGVFRDAHVAGLLCASKDDEVVEYALSRTASPALIAAYQTQLPDKALLQAKLHEFYWLNLAGDGEEGV